MSTFCHLPLCLAFLLACLPPVCGPSDGAKGIIRCRDYLAMDNRARTPMVIWLVNERPPSSAREWTDFNEAELVLTPILTQLCHQQPDAPLRSLRSELISYQQVHSLN